MATITPADLDPRALEAAHRAHLRSLQGERGPKAQNLLAVAIAAYLDTVASYDEDARTRAELCR